jgi:hypothetical protein
MKAKLPLKKDLIELVKAIKKDVPRLTDSDASDYIDKFAGDTHPSITLTVGWSKGGDWNYQTGDNSYTGGAYLHRYWAVVYVFKTSNCPGLADEILEQLSEYTYD